MIGTRTVPVATALCALLGAAMLAAPAAAQARSAAELRRENEQLRARADDLARELAAARTEIESLRAQLAKLTEQNVELRRLLASTGPDVGGTAAAPAGAPTGPTAPVTTVDESVPNASPRALFRAIVDGYGEVTNGIEMGVDDDDPRRVVYLRRVDRWVRRVNRELTEPITWHVVLEDGTIPIRHGVPLTLRAVDPETEAPLGDPFDVYLTRSLLARVGPLIERRPDEKVLVLKGVLRPQIVYNRDRLSEGPFNRPPFVGPFAEFGFAVDVMSLVPRPKRKSGASPEAGTGAGDSSDPEAGTDSEAERSDR